MLAELADTTAHVVNGYGGLGLASVLTVVVSRLVSAFKTKWEKDRAQQLAIATAYRDALNRGFLNVARALQRPEDRETVPLEVERVTSQPIVVAPPQ